MIFIVFFTLGLILIIGAFFRWRWLVDPPLEWAPMYSQALLKLIVGTRGVVWFTYFLGLLFLLAGPVGYYHSIFHSVRHL